MNRWRYWLVLVAVACLAACPGYGEGPSEPEPVDFTRDVQPILRQHCQKCHGGVHREGGLSLLTRDDALAELDSGTMAIVPGDAQGSELLRRVTSTESSERMPPEGDPLTEYQTDVLRRWIVEGVSWPNHWSFQPIRRPELPASCGGEHNPIDQFVLSRLSVANLAPSPEASRSTLIRRLYLDLVGLLPSVDEVDEFCSDPRPDAYPRLVDRLLSSPHFGERWGRHWLDQARYADTDGYEVDGPRDTAWLWRDWVIASLNRDMPFDQFTREQIAGDLLDEATESQRLATSFHRQSLTNREGGIDQGEARYKELVDRVNAVGTIWLGLTLGCAQCHNHPYDPITQREYFELYAFFHRTDDSELSARQAAKPLVAQVVTQASESRQSVLYERGDYSKPGGSVEPRLPRWFGALSTGAPRSVLPDRLDLAQWIVHRENPLFARVAANQVWIRLFGAGLVRTPDDFGAQGVFSTHRELLDWLADEYRASGYSTKQLIRLIVNSATYRQSSRHRVDAESVDPLNEWWHRQNRHRVEAELVHDLSLAAGGLLTCRIGGRSFYPPLPDAVLKLSFRSNYVWKESTGEERYRRGMYIYYKRTLPHPNLDTFDCPDATVARMQRETSNTPLQALTSLNQELFLDAARGLGWRVLARATQDEERIVFLFRQSLCRPPTDRERTQLTAFLKQSRAWYRDHPEDAQALVGAGFESSADFSEAAAWVAVCNIVLNLDEFLTRE